METDFLYAHSRGAGEAPSAYSSANVIDLYNSTNHTSSSDHGDGHGSSHHTALGYMDMLRLLTFLLAVWLGGQAVSKFAPAIVRVFCICFVAFVLVSRARLHSPDPVAAVGPAPRNRSEEQPKHCLKLLATDFTFDLPPPAGRGTHRRLATRATGANLSTSVEKGTVPRQSLRIS